MIFLNTFSPVEFLLVSDGSKRAYSSDSGGNDVTSEDIDYEPPHRTNIAADEVDDVLRDSNDDNLGKLKTFYEYETNDNKKPMGNQLPLIDLANEETVDELDDNGGSQLIERNTVQHFRVRRLQQKVSKVEKNRKIKNETENELNVKNFTTKT